MIMIFFGMIAIIFAVCLLSNTGSLLLLPLTTPGQFLARMPYVSLSLFGKEIVLIQPSSTFFVYLLGIIMIIIGIYFLSTRNEQQSRYFWGIGLILWGISAIVAGTSYQAFGYELKCRGQAFCLFTSNFELAYMLLTAYCINFLVVATGYTSTGSKGRKWLKIFALADSILYSLYMIVGAVIPVKFMISYEGFMAFIGLNFILMFILNIRHFVQHKDILNRNLIIIWIGFFMVNIGYFVFLFGGYPATLYQTLGIWFNENDVLHLLLIVWAFMIYFLLKDNAFDIRSEKIINNQVSSLNNIN